MHGLPLEFTVFPLPPLAPFHSGNVIEVFELGGVFPEKVS